MRAEEGERKARGSAVERLFMLKGVDASERESEELAGDMGD